MYNDSWVGSCVRWCVCVCMCGRGVGVYNNLLVVRSRLEIDVREVLVRMRAERPHYSVTELCSLSGTIVKWELTNWLAMI